MDVYPYRGDAHHAASCHPGWLLQGGLEVAGVAPAGPERLVDRLRGDFAHNRGRLGHRVGHPLASFVVPEGGIVGPLIQFLIFVGVFTLTFSLGEEIGIRGYLQPRLMVLGRTRALLLVGLLWATWHQVLIFLTPVDFPTGNLLLFFPLFYGTIVAASFLFGYLRIYTGSVWPASIAHSVHNAAWPLLGGLTVTSSPVLVNLYLVGDFGILILVATALGAVWVGRMLRSGMDEAQEAGAVPAVPPTPAAAAVPR